MQKVLITGAAGFLGQGIRHALRGKAEMRLMDVAPFDAPDGEILVGSVVDPADCERAASGVDALVIAHMLSRTTNRQAYDEPSLPFDVNVKGAANLFHQARRQGIGTVVLISSSGVIRPYEKPGHLITRDLEARPKGNVYLLTKACQEKIAEFYHATHGIRVAVLRVGDVVSVDDATKEVRNKYGKAISQGGNDALIERRDVGEVVCRCLDLPDLGHEVFYVMGTAAAAQRYDVEYTCQRLDWRPAYDFSWLPAAPAAPPNKT